MFDIGWSELLLIGVVAVVAIGPKELPQVMRGLGQGVRRLQYMKFALSRQFDDFMRESELHDLHKNLKSGTEAFDEEGEDESYIAGLPRADEKKEEA